ncbi:MAG: DsrE/DsrF/TusD sulfur relay family protein [Candidatus Hermodarchaeota archaeon]
MVALITIILNEAPYGSERSYNGLRTAMALLKGEDTQVNVFLMADATFCALEGQTTPDGYYNIERMITFIARKGKIGACGTCMDARGLSNPKLVDGIHRSSMAELTDWILSSENVITF